MRLPSELENRLWQELTTLECNKRMPYVTSVERIGYQRGRLEGLKEGREEGRRKATAMAQTALRWRFGALPPEIEERIAALTMERIDALGNHLEGFVSLADVDAWLQPH